MVAEIGTIFVDHLLRHCRPEMHGEHVEEGGLRLAEPDRESIGVRRLQTGGMLRFSGDDLVGTLDHAEVALGRTLRLRIEDALEGVLKVRSSHLPAILEFNAMPELKGISLAVTGDG